MTVADDRLYHQERARAELDSAYHADGRAAATAHLLLSSLHMRRFEALRIPPPDEEGGTSDHAPREMNSPAGAAS
ncbi:MAG: hypothetical protein JWO81_96 [Alphaproteobacteria bacterium]|nr:hypothetical protein [Alphaproteobacteria bacterium]